LVLHEKIEITCIKKLKTVKFRECILPFGPAYFVFPSCLWLWNFVFHIKGRMRLFENRVLRKVFEPKRDVTADWKTLHDEKLHNLYSSTITFQVMKSRKRQWEVHVALMWDRRIVAGNPRESGHEEACVDRKLIINLIL
jgi:hypothetical protein